VLGYFARLVILEHLVKSKCMNQ